MIRGHVLPDQRDLAHAGIGQTFDFGDDLLNRPRGESVKKYLNARGFRILGALDQVAAQHHSVPAVVSLAWLMARPSVTAPIASATSLDQLDDLIEATKLELAPSSIQLLNMASAVE